MSCRSEISENVRQNVWISTNAPWQYSSYSLYKPTLQADSFTNFRASGWSKIEPRTNHNRPCGFCFCIDQSDCSILKLVTVEGSSLISVQVGVNWLHYFNLVTLIFWAFQVGVNRVPCGDTLVISLGRLMKLPVRKTMHTKSLSWFIAN